MRMIYIMLQGHICEITLSYVYPDTRQRMRISKISLMAYMNSFVIFAKTVHQEKQKLIATINIHAKETCKHLLYLSNEDKEKIISDLDKVQVACYYLTILLAFERRTSLTSTLATLYKNADKRKRSFRI